MAWEPLVMKQAQCYQIKKKSIQTFSSGGFWRQIENTREKKPQWMSPHILFKSYQLFFFISMKLITLIIFENGFQNMHDKYYFV